MRYFVVVFLIACLMVMAGCQENISAPLQENTQGVIVPPQQLPTPSSNGPTTEPGVKGPSGPPPGGQEVSDIPDMDVVMADMDM